MSGKAILGILFLMLLIGFGALMVQDQQKRRPRKSEADEPARPAAVTPTPSPSPLADDQFFAQADRFIRACQKMQSKRTVGLNLEQFTDVLGDMQAEYDILKGITEPSKAGIFLQRSNLMLSSYRLAAQYWNQADASAAVNRNKHLDQGDIELADVLKEYRLVR